ncbi:MAG: phosphoribosylamine--glycine ligase [Spirochaetaceae bacterium]|nr:MAG: phosphoribosylamine--glycine ligase [Spirochaetaceae bacterium]
MRVLILGNGAREHAITWKFSQSRRIAGLFVAPGNAGTNSIATNLPHVNPCDPQEVLDACQGFRINHVFIGGEDPLAAGVSDALIEAGIPCIGPRRKTAQLETSKAFSKAFMERNGIPTAQANAFTYFPAFERVVRERDHRLVLKKSGLAAGKGVLESDDTDEMLAYGKSVLETDTLVVEDHLVGYEVSVFAITDGITHQLLPCCTDYKKAGDGGTGPNTGGMGSICPVPWLENTAWEQIQNEIVEPTFTALRAEGLSFVGVLYFGIMVTANGPFVLEYNVRFGDPEAQVLLPLIRADFGDLCEAMTKQRLSEFSIEVSPKSSVGVVVAAKGYPGVYDTGIPVTGLPTDDSALVFHAATTERDGVTLTGSGRCFTVVGRGKELLDAMNTAYAAVGSVRFDGAWFRSDIGGRIFGN